jgi:sterile alpha motif and leucine zipper-containing kinase AZK
MGAPGILIPAEVPNSQLPNFGFDMRSFVDVIGTTRDMSLAVDEGTRTLAVPPDLGRVLEFGSSKSDEASALGIQTEENQTERFEYQWDKLLPSLHKSCESSTGTHGKASSAQKKKVKDVSKYVISAAKNPEFAQKLHAVLLESGASPPPDLFSDINPHDLGEQKALEPNDIVNSKSIENEVQCGPDKFLSNNEQSLVPYTRVELMNNVNCDKMQKLSAEWLAKQHKELETSIITSGISLSSEPTAQGFVLIGSGTTEPFQTDAMGVNMVTINHPQMVARPLHEEQFHESFLDTAADTCQRQRNIASVSDDKECFQDKIGRVFSDIEYSKESSVKLLETANNDLSVVSDANSEGSNPVPREVAEWEIRWEDLQIGERIGIGKIFSFDFFQFHGKEKG